MIPTVQFDPATLAIWTTTGTLPADAKDLAGRVMLTAARGGDPAAPLAGLPAADPLRRRLLWLASCVWHEKRHFLDICLTNDGARRFRDLWTMAGNLFPVGGHALGRGEPLCLPVEVYACPVMRRRLGLATPPDDVQAVARMARRMKAFRADLDAAPADAAGSSIELGGHAMLEGLAQVSQINAIEHRFGPSDAEAATREWVHRQPLAGPYRSIEVIAQALGSARTRSDGAVLINPGLAAAMFVTALCGRFFGAGPTPEPVLVAPWARFAALFERLNGRGRFDMPDEEAAALVDAAARAIWGRTALEEVAADIAAMEARIAAVGAANDWLVETGLIAAADDFIAMRRRMLAELNREGLAGLLPRAFPLRRLDRLRPWHVLATPGLGEDGLASDAPVLFGMSWERPGRPALEASWARLDTADPGEADVIAPSDREAWVRMLTEHGPAALLMLNGRRHRRMVPPEIEQRIARLEEEIGTGLRFHPQFEWPPSRDATERSAEAAALADFAGRDSFVCDVTGDTIAPAEAAVLTAWELRRSALRARVEAEAGASASLLLAANWSDWVVRRDLAETLAG